VRGRVAEPPDDSNVLKSVARYFDLGFELFDSVQTALDENAFNAAFKKFEVRSLQRRVLKIDGARRTGSGAVSGGSRAGRGRGLSSSTDSDGSRHGRRADGAAAAEKPASAARAPVSHVKVPPCQSASAGTLTYVKVPGGHYGQSFMSK